MAEIVTKVGAMQKEINEMKVGMHMMKYSFMAHAQDVGARMMDEERQMMLQTTAALPGMVDEMTDFKDNLMTTMSRMTRMNDQMTKMMTTMTRMAAAFDEQVN